MVSRTATFLFAIALAAMAAIAPPPSYAGRIERHPAAVFELRDRKPHQKQPLDRAAEAHGQSSAGAAAPKTQCAQSQAPFHPARFQRPPPTANFGL